MPAEQNPSLHIDTDWKKQAQEEKRRLAEQEAKRTAPAPQGAPAAPAAGGGPPGTGAAASPRARGAGRGAREIPPASFASLVQSLMTQALFYLGELAPQGSEPMLNLDMAKHQIDTLGVLEEKTRGNLTDEEKRLLDLALYETRQRYISVASQYL